MMKRTELAIGDAFCRQLEIERTTKSSVQKTKI